ncbi:MAG TPA: hypothetical protein VK462_00880, partial [Nitrososphaeraceae archaeon]|nr:hypothetical protein [Nitrososphaeraceae archaeon]
VDVVVLFTDVEVILELELPCAAAYIPDISVLVIINTTNINETRKTEILVNDFTFLIIALCESRIKG